MNKVSIGVLSVFGLVDHGFTCLEGPFRRRGISWGDFFSKYPPLHYPQTLPRSLGSFEFGSSSLRENLRRAAYTGVARRTYAIDVPEPPKYVE